MGAKYLEGKRRRVIGQVSKMLETLELEENESKSMEVHQHVVFKGKRYVLQGTMQPVHSAKPLTVDLTKEADDKDLKR